MQIKSETNVNLLNRFMATNDTCYSTNNFTHSALQFACTFLASRCYNTERLENILKAEPNGDRCLDMIEDHVPRPQFNAIVVHLKRIVWKFVKCMYIKNDRLRSMCLDRSRDCDDFVMSSGNAFANDIRLSRYLKPCTKSIIYTK
ncbi:hypothetical protein KM620_gp099 [Hyposidra talaca nucleopolyhedrovirus]|uniref:Uncharacterized protein n=1 Tax=Hyposidra talaca nucleopolyhedrovirus TaxID=1070315 RepID=A0A2Z4HI47_9ABAC|nr:hypothetical protein KM620_gp099 [Hyposidra talaca nucleopolyhedrovirus]AWW14459.1 hypothetical protein HytaNPV_gp099 [Hyposidra talaca nucleopolyhedrovirus]